jgi:DNA-binding response OmpR family regulator
LERRRVGENMPKTIMVVDDKASLRKMVDEYLTGQGFRVVTATNGQEALFVAREEKPDLILLDIMMPEMDGYEFIRVFSRESETPIILLTAKLEESDKVVGLELGADDYVTKPFGMRELLARIRAVLRRAAKSAPPAEVLCAADVTLDKGARTVSVGGRSVKLTPTEFDLLAELMSAPGRVFDRAALLEAVQGVAIDGMERSINVHISNLRSKIEPDPSKPRYIETAFGVGYRFCADSPPSGE